MAMFFLIGAVVGLYWVKNPNTKLIILSALTVGFAATLALLTNARRQDVFAATAAYAAVLVVFISGNLTPGENGSKASPVTSQATATATVTLTNSVATTMISTTTLMASSITNSAISTISATPGSSGGLSRSETIGIGVGIGVGVPGLLVSILGYWFARRRKSQVNVT